MLTSGAGLACYVGDDSNAGLKGMRTLSAREIFGLINEMPHVLSIGARL